MKKQGFLNKIMQEGKLELVEPSEEVCSSYLEKADGCLKSAKLLLQHQLYENSVSMSYYAMYNSLVAFLFKTGIKCENHAASILLLKFLFDKKELFKIISSAKEERIDKQYYVSSKENNELTEESSTDMLRKTEEFLIQIKLLITNSGVEYIEAVRKKFTLFYDSFYGV